MCRWKDGRQPECDTQVSHTDVHNKNTERNRSEKKKHKRRGAQSRNATKKGKRKSRHPVTQPVKKEASAGKMSVM